MKGHLLRGGWRRAAHLTAATLAITGAGAMSGCLSRELQVQDTRTTSTFVSSLTESAVDKIDLLLMIDNSRSMADKQQILAAAVPDLVKGLVNPKCVDADKPEDATLWEFPASPTDKCTEGKKRDFNPVLNIHIAIITSSIGGHGSDACPDAETFSCSGGATNTTNNDAGHLVTRSDPCSGAPVPTYAGDKGFLAWDPESKQTPPGETNIGELAINPTTLAVSTMTPGLVPSLKDLVLGTGQIGCGYEAQNESWYRFLIDPDPYQTIIVESDKATPKDIDNTLLQQRADFLRPSSLLAIIGLTDENDCSIKEYGQFYYAAQQRDRANPNKNFYLPKARSECATNPNDKCCRSCGQDQTGCPADPNCDGSSLDAKTDDVNLRCFDQKRRFGIDFLYPTDRYVTGLTQTLVPNRAGEMVPNPIFSDLNPSDEDSNIRDAGLVFLAYIVGVPWQDIARQDMNGNPDLLAGLDAKGNPVGGFKTAAELSAEDANGESVWKKIIGDPANYIPPADPLMIESTAPRMGTNPFTGDAIAPTTAPADTNPINGHEYTPNTDMGVQKWPDDLQYACIFKLPTARDCSDPNLVSCDCHDPLNDNPLCEPDTSKAGNPRTLQVRAKAYPGIRELSLIKEIGTQGIVGSICPKQLDNLDAPDFGYRPAIGAIIDRLKLALGGQCLPRKLNPDKDGQVQCLILEGRNTNGEHKNDCDSYCGTLTARQAVSKEHKPAVNDEDVQRAAKQSNLDCFCEITQLTDGDSKTTNDDFLTACQTQTSDAPALNGQSVDGWCYIDATTTPPLGDPELVKTCPGTEKRKVRFVGAGNPKAGSTLFITCTGE